MKCSVKKECNYYEKYDNIKIILVNTGGTGHKCRESHRHA
jgi:hypothetical protein